MKKIIIVLNFLVLTLFISGCGCSKKEEEKILKCSSELDEYNEKKVVTATFVDDLLKTEKVEIVILFDEEEMAQEYYDMYKDTENYKYELNGKEVSFEITVENDSTDSIFEYNEFYDNMIKQNYECNLN